MTDTTEQSNEIEQIKRLAFQLFAQTANYQDLTLVHLASLTGRNVYWLEHHVFPPPQWMVMRDAWAKDRLQPVMERMYQHARTREDFSAKRIAQLAGVSREVFIRLLGNEWQQRLKMLPTPQERMTSLVWQLVEEHMPLEQFTRKHIGELAGVSVSGCGRWFSELYRAAYLALQQYHHEQGVPLPQGSQMRCIAGTWIDLDSDAWDLRSAGLRVLRKDKLRPDIAAMSWPLLREELRVGDLAPSTINTHYQAFVEAGKLLGETIPNVCLASLEQIQHAWLIYPGTIVLRRRARLGLMRLFETLLNKVGLAHETRRNERYRIAGWLRDLIALPHDEPASAFLSEEELNTVLACCLADIQAGMAYMRSSPDLRIQSGRDRPLHSGENARTVIYWATALMIVLMSCTGLRRQSILSLEVEDWMELRAGLFGVIWHHWKKGEEHLAVISPLIARLLGQYVETTAELRKALQTKRVFLNGNLRGLWEVMSSAAFEARLREFSRRHRIERYGTRISLGSTLFRRTFTTRALYEGRSLEALRSQLGHTTIMSTLLYSKLDLFEHPSQVRTPLDLYGRQALTLWKTPQRLGDLSPAERTELLKSGMARDQGVGRCRYDRCIQVEQGSPPPCSLCEHLVTGREFLTGWLAEEKQREHVLQQLAAKPGAEILAAQLKGQFEQFKRNLAWVLAEPEETQG